MEAHEDRIGKIGSSDIAAVLGRNRYCSPLVAWKRITGREVFDGNADTEFGKLMEDPIARVYERQTGARLASVDRITHPRLPWLIATIDRVAFHEGTTPWIVEIKAPGTWGAWSRGVPEMYLAQVQHQLGMAREGTLRVHVVSAAGRYATMTVPHINDRADVIACCGRPRTFEVVFDEGELERMWTEVVDWHHRYIVKDTPPPETALDHAEVAAREVSADVLDLIERLKAKKQAQKTLDDEVEKLADIVREEFGPFHALEHEGRLLATYKPRITPRIDTKALRAKYPQIAAEVTIKAETRTLLPKEW